MPSKLAERIDTMGKRITNLLPSTQGGFLTNKWFLYLVLFSAVFDLFYFYNRDDMYAVTIFFIIGFLVSFFSKNMVVVLILAIALTHLIRYGKKLSEGFEGDEEDKEEGFEDDEEDKEGFEGEDEDKEEGFEEDEDKEEGFEGDDEDREESFEGEDEDKEESFEGPSTTSHAIKKTAKQVNDYKSANMDEQTKMLLSTQNKLMENMKTLEPMLAKAESFLSKKQTEKFTSLADAYKPLMR